ncbi:MAG TPA: PQQ-binding-like beta-propeller repeat protein [Gemmataceae bacterium]|nr:PQQ-binding-like beta-propeller repeat protein [Gemmataceae bacterium]
MNRLLIAMTLTLALGAAASAGTWPQWRGPQNNGISEELNLPAEWTDSKNMLWKLPLPGMGSSTPCVWGNRIFLTSGDTSDQLLAMCISTDGKEVWRKVLNKGAAMSRKADEGNNASPSPSTDGKHVWFFVGTGEVACFDFDGNEVWKFNAQERYGRFKMGYGMHITPALYAGHLYFQLLHDNGQNVISVNASTGKDDWKVSRISDGRAENLHSYASPFVWTDGKDALLVTHGNDYTIGHDLKDGKEVWRVEGLNPKGNYNPTLRFVASPVCTPDLIVIPTAKRAQVVAIKPTARGKVAAGSEFEVWRRPSGTPDVPSPLVHDGLVYIVREDGTFQCWDAKTGKDVYPTQRLHQNRHRASPVYADGKVYAISRDGVVSVVKAGPKFELLGSNRMQDDITASPAVADGRIYLRGFKNLYAIGTK